jgi:hypothetical protein
MLKVDWTCVESIMSFVGQTIGEAADAPGDLLDDALSGAAETIRDSSAVILGLKATSFSTIYDQRLTAVATLTAAGRAIEKIRDARRRPATPAHLTLVWSQ